MSKSVEEMRADAQAVIEAKTEKVKAAPVRTHRHQSHRVRISN